MPTEADVLDYALSNILVKSTHEHVFEEIKDFESFQYCESLIGATYESDDEQVKFSILYMNKLLYSGE